MAVGLVLGGVLKFLGLRFASTGEPPAGGGEPPAGIREGEAAGPPVRDEAVAPRQEVRQRSEQRGLTPNPGATEAELGAFEKRHGIALPETLRSYLAAVDGMPDGITDEELLHFWPLSEIAPLSEAAPELVNSAGSEAAKMFVFADYSLWAHAYAVHLDGGVFVVGGDAPTPVASSLDEFLERYLEDPGSVVD